MGKNLAVKYFEEGYNCAQAVFLAYSDKFMDKETATKLSSSYGGGMGRLREVCGAVTAMFAIAGLEKGYNFPDNDEMKAKHYDFIQNMANEFKEKQGSIICREILNTDDNSPNPTKRTKDFYENRPCENCIITACKIIDKLIYNKK